ncbi:MAG: DUF2157 domain-containing protein [Proteobacteria bacterium]|nr:DUF2157 domain-containing protein [Pseudomonadota bacterium]
MNYKDRVAKDIDRWIDAGFVAAERRAPMLDMIVDPRRLDAATALAWVGGALLGIALVSFVAANWDGMTPIVRFSIIVGGFLMLAAGGAWAAHKKRPVLTNILVMLAAIAYASAVGLTAQIFDLPSDTRAASYGAGLAAYGLALAGRSTGAATVALILIGLGDFAEHRWFVGGDTDTPWMLFAAPLGAYLALRWGSAPLAHVAALALLYCATWFAARTHADAVVFLFIALVLGAAAGGARWLRQRGHQFAGVFYGWFALGALIFFAVAGYLPWLGPEGSANAGMAHRLVWLVASSGLIALGRLDRHVMATAIGVLSLIGAVVALLADLGLDLLASAGVFLICALAALVGGLLLRGRTKPI